MIELVPSQENAALYDEIAHLEEKFVRAKEERRFVHIHLSSLQNILDWNLICIWNTFFPQILHKVIQKFVVNILIKSYRRR